MGTTESRTLSPKPYEYGRTVDSVEGVEVPVYAVIMLAEASESSHPQALNPKHQKLKDPKAEKKGLLSPRP